jgi:myo-inositol-1(or 4)-monophosphatase
VGVVYQPMLNVCYSAYSDGGAWMDGGHWGSSPSHGEKGEDRVRLPFVREPINPLGKEAPKGCIFSCEWGKDRRDRPEGNMYKKIESFVNMASEIGGRGGKGGMVHGVRSLGR